MATAPNSDPQITEAEWAARQQLAACYRVFDYLGWTEVIYNHITYRVPARRGRSSSIRSASISAR